MSNPEVSEAQDAETSELSLEEQVNQYAKLLQQGAELPETVDEATRFAAMAEKRRRDTFSSYTKAQQELKALQARTKLLEEKALANVPAQLDDRMRAELDELKYSDPERWRRRMNQLEAEVKSKTRDELDKQATQVSELELRREVLATFMEEHPGFELSDEVIANDVPPRYTKLLEKGEISFADFLQEVHSYLTSNKVVKSTEQVLEQPSFTKTGGATAPTNKAMAADIVSSYSAELY
jgi:hypothetical protein